MGKVRVALVVVCVAAGCGRFGFDTDDDDVPEGMVRITVVRSGPGTGTVVGPGGFDCGPTCTLDVDTGTAIVLRGLAATGSWLAGWSGPCGGNFNCEFVATESTTVVAELSPRPNRVFVTSMTVDGAFGGIGPADKLCQARANAAGLDGAFVAYLSGATATAADRIASARGWIRIDGAPVADSPSRFAAGPLIFAPRTDEYGDDTMSARVFTGSAGGAAATHCLDWTSNLVMDEGAIVYSDWGSTFASASSPGECSAQNRLVCVERSENVAVAIAPNIGRLAFVTTGSWIPGGGRASADALCGSEALAAGAPGTYLAALATTTETIASRFAPDPPWQRIDGVRLIRDKRLFVVDYLDVAPELDLGRQVIKADYWTGTVRFNALADPVGNCDDWTIGDPSANGDMHFTTSTFVAAAAKRYPCNSAGTQLLCLQE